MEEKKKLNERNHLVLMLINNYVSVNVLWYRMFFFENLHETQHASELQQQQHN